MELEGSCTVSKLFQLMYLTFKSQNGNEGKNSHDSVLLR